MAGHLDPFPNPERRDGTVEDVYARVAVLKEVGLVQKGGGDHPLEPEHICFMPLPPALQKLSNVMSGGFVSPLCVSGSGASAPETARLPQSQASRLARMAPCAQIRPIDRTEFLR